MKYNFVIIYDKGSCKQTSLYKCDYTQTKDPYKFDPVKPALLINLFTARCIWKSCNKHIAYINNKQITHKGVLVQYKIIPAY